MSFAAADNSDRPKCPKCKEPLHGQCIKFGRQEIHLTCFLCAGENCGKQLASRKVVQVAGKAYCDQCARLAFVSSVGSGGIPKIAPSKPLVESPSAKRVEERRERQIDDMEDYHRGKRRENRAQRRRDLIELGVQIGLIRIDNHLSAELEIDSLHERMRHRKARRPEPKDNVWDESDEEIDVGEPEGKELTKEIRRQEEEEEEERAQERKKRREEEQEAREKEQEELSKERTEEREARQKEQEEEREREEREREESSKKRAEERVQEQEDVRKKEEEERGKEREREESSRAQDELLIRREEESKQKSESEDAIVESTVDLAEKDPKVLLAKLEAKGERNLSDAETRAKRRAERNLERKREEEEFELEMEQRRLAREERRRQRQLSME